jgi:hypothetical protein
MPIRLYILESFGIVMGAAGCIGGIWLMVHQTNGFWIMLLCSVCSASLVFRSARQIVRYAEHPRRNTGFEVKLAAELPVRSEKERDNDHG